MVPQKLRGWDMESLIAFIYRRDLHKVLTLGSVIGNPLSILNPSLIWRERERESTIEDAHPICPTHKIRTPTN